MIYSFFNFKGTAKQLRQLLDTMCNLCQSTSTQQQEIDGGQYKVCLTCQATTIIHTK